MKRMGLLSAPVRVLWDLSLGIGGISRDCAARAADELLALKIFYITVRMAEAVQPAAEIIKKLTSANTALSVSGPDVFPGWDTVKGIKALDIYNPLPGSLTHFSTTIKNAPEGVLITVTVIPEKGRLEELLQTIKEGIDLGIKVFSIANPDLVRGPDSNSSRFILDAADREYLKHGLESLLTPHGDKVKLLVHDLFLHEALKIPGLGRTEYAGCQAGDAIAYIAADGTVYPCASFPLPLGNIKENTLKEIWSGEARRKLREDITALPDKCAACGLAGECKGACRGLAYARGGLNLPDPSCGK